MKYFAFVFFSSLEYIAFIFFILVLFRFGIRENLVKFVVFSIVLSLVSNSLQSESLQAVSSLIQAVLMICFVAFFLRVHWLNAAIMVITGYVLNFIVQWTIIAVTLHFSGRQEIDPNTTDAYLIQTASAAVMFLFAVVTRLLKGGFSFIDQDSRFRRSKVFARENRPFAAFLLFSILATFVANLLLGRQNPPYLAIAIVLFAAMIGLIYICVKRDEQSHG
jgi:hypothetical protein